MSNQTSNQRREYDLSVRNLPESWLQAEIDSPTTNDVTPLGADQRKLVMPKGYRVSPLNILLAALLGGFVSGLGWYLLDRFNIYSGPWTAVAVGVAIALTVRVAAGPGDVPVRAISSLLAYLSALVAVLVAVTWTDINAIYGSVGFGTAEEFLVQNHIKQLDHLAAYVVGAVATLQISYLLRHR